MLFETYFNKLNFEHILVICLEDGCSNFQSKKITSTMTTNRSKLYMNVGAVMREKM